MSATYWSLTALIKTPWVHPDTVRHVSEHSRRGESKSESVDSVIESSATRYRERLLCTRRSDRTSYDLQVTEKGFATLNVVVGAVVFAAILGNITAMINSFDKSNAQLREVMATLNRLIGKYDVPSKLQKRVFMCVLIRVVVPGPSEGHGRG